MRTLLAKEALAKILHVEGDLSAREQRKLAAVWAADVVGYSRLMGRDEAGTLARLREHRAERLEPALSRNGGRLVKLLGDGALAEFPSAVDAVRAAIEFQQAMVEANVGQLDESRIVFRLGLHLGDLIVDGDDLYGDGVNVAARLEGRAVPGGIVVSAAVHDAVAGRLQATFHDLGMLSLRNIERPIHAYAVTGGDAPSASAPTTGMTDTPALALPDKPSIAVLPFQNMSGDPEQEYFVDGLVEDIITALSRFKSLFVVARNSSFTYKGRAVDLAEVGRDLGVQYVLQGSVRKVGERVRISGQLVDVESGGHLWTERVDGSLAEIFDLQDQVTERVVGAVAPRVEQAEINRARRRPASSLDAYDCYLRALVAAHSQTKFGLEESLGLARRAIELDPEFSAAYGVCAFCYGMSQVQGFLPPLGAAEVEVRRLAERVAAIGQDDAFALGSVAFAMIRVCRDHGVSADFADRALAVNPNLLMALTSRSEVHLHAGEHAEAIALAERAVRLSPQDPMIPMAELLMAFAHLFEGRYDEAIKWATRSLVRNPDNAAGLRAAAAAYAWSDRFPEASRLAAKHRELVPQFGVAAMRGRSLYTRAEDVDRLFDGLRLAGFPE